MRTGRRWMKIEEKKIHAALYLNNRIESVDERAGRIIVKNARVQGGRGAKKKKMHSS